MTRALTKTNELANTIQRLEGEVARALPAHMDAGRFCRTVLTAIRRNPKLADCSQTSFLAAMLQSAQLGLMPEDGLGSAYLVPFRGEIQLIPGYRGLIDLAFRSGRVLSLYAHCVYENDRFVYELGLNRKLEHTPHPDDATRGKMTHVYAVAHLKDGASQFVVLSKAAVDKIRAGSPGKNSPAWCNYYEEMAMAKAVRKLAKWLPLSSDMARAVSIDEAADAALPQPFDVEITVPVEEPVAEVKEPELALDKIMEAVK